jgi:hypothetical protein
MSTWWSGFLCQFLLDDAPTYQVNSKTIRRTKKWHGIWLSPNPFHGNSLNIHPYPFPSRNLGPRLQKLCISVCLLVLCYNHRHTWTPIRFVAKEWSFKSVYDQWRLTQLSTRNPSCKVEVPGGLPNSIALPNRSETRRHRKLYITTDCFFYQQTAKRTNHA